MIKTKQLKALLLTAAFICLSSPGDFFNPPKAMANGVIVTEPENVPPPKPAPKKAAPKKKPPVKKSLPPPPSAKSPAPPKPTPLDEALILMEMRHFTKATAMLEQVLVKEPFNARAWFALGNAYKARGFFPKAQRAYKKALEIDPSYKELNRILEYPALGERQPLWDPKRPGRVEEIPLAVDGFRVLPPIETGVPRIEEAPVAAAPPTPAPESEPPSPKPPAVKKRYRPTEGNSISPISGVPVRVVGPAPSKADGPTATPSPATPPPSEEGIKSPVAQDGLPIYQPPAPSQGQDAPVYIPPPPPSDEQP